MPSSGAPLVATSMGLPCRFCVLGTRAGRSPKFCVNSTVMMLLPSAVHAVLPPEKRMLTPLGITVRSA